MIYIILGVGVVVAIAVTMMNKGGGANKGGDPALNAAKRVRDSVHLTDDGKKNLDGGSFVGEKKSDETESESQGIDEQKVMANFAADIIWSGKGAKLEIGGVSIPGPMAYWSNGPAKVQEPSCIDITLPVKFDENIGMPEIQSSYNAMPPEHRGAYLRWLSRGRMGAISHSYFRLWFFGIERRAMFDKKDTPMCLGEISSRLPSLLENPSLAVILRFMTCTALSMKYPTDRLALDLRCVAALPAEILNVLLAPYSDSEVRLPSLIAYTVMRSAFPGNSGPVLHNEEQLRLFNAAYNDGMEMGMSLAKPKAVAFVAYFPTNPSLSGPKPLMSVETPDFFKDPSQFAPLLAIWEQVRNMRLSNPTPLPRKKRKLPEAKQAVPPEGEEGAEGLIEPPEIEELPTTLDKEMRADIDSYIEENLDGEKEPLILQLLDLSELIELEMGERPTGAQRRGLCDITRTGGRLIVPELGVAGKSYNWEDYVSLVWVEIGERVSDAYRAAAILFEFAVAVTESLSGKKKRLADLLQRLTLHIKLDEKELERMNILSEIFELETLSHENFADSFQNWLQPEDREFMRDFLFRLCTTTDSNARDRDEVLSKLSAALGVEGRPQPIANMSPQETGEKLVLSLTRLFRSEEPKK